MASPLCHQQGHHGIEKPTITIAPLQAYCNTSRNVSYITDLMGTLRNISYITHLLGTLKNVSDITDLLGTLRNVCRRLRRTRGEDNADQKLNQIGISRKQLHLWHHGCFVQQEMISKNGQEENCFKDERDEHILWTICSGRLELNWIWKGSRSDPCNSLRSLCCNFTQTITKHKDPISTVLLPQTHFMLALKQIFEHVTRVLSIWELLTAWDLW